MNDYLNSLKSAVLERRMGFEKLYKSYPKYVIISDDMLMRLKIDTDVYMNRDERYQPWQSFMGMVVCTSPRIVNFDDIEVY